MTKPKRTISYEEWAARRPEAIRRSAAIDRLMPPYARERPRNPDEAELLRELGVPENMIGPSKKR
jgi:hypothetical protein